MPLLRTLPLRPLGALRFSARRAPTATAAFHTSASARKEGTENPEKRAQEIEYAKQQQQQKQRSDGGEASWREELSSSSEDAVKADRGEASQADKGPEELQRETEDLPKKKYGQE